MTTKTEGPAVEKAIEWTPEGHQRPLRLVVWLRNPAPAPWCGTVSSYRDATKAELSAAGYIHASALEALRAELATEREGRRHLEEAARLLRESLDPAHDEDSSQIVRMAREQKEWLGRDQALSAPTAKVTMNNSATDENPAVEATAGEAPPCAECGGDGYYKGPRLGDEPCPGCGGTGFGPAPVAEAPKLPVEIPDCPHGVGLCTTDCPRQVAIRDQSKLPTSEGARRLDHSLAWGMALKLKNTKHFEILNRYIAQSEATEREAAGLRQELDTSRGQCRALQEVRLVESRAYVASQSALTEAQAKLAESEGVRDVLAAEAEKRGKERDALKKRLQAQAEELTALRELEHWARADTEGPCMADILAKLDALRAKPAQQADQKPPSCGHVRPPQPHPADPSCVLPAGHDGDHAAMSVDGAPAGPRWTAEKPAQAEQKEPILPLCSQCGAIDGQCAGMGCLTKEERTEPADPAQPQLQGDGVTRAELVAALRDTPGFDANGFAYSPRQFAELVADKLERKQP